MAALGAQSIASSYEQLLHCDRNLGGNGTTHVSVKDGDNGTTFGFTIATDALMMSSTNRLEFGDTGTYIHQSADGVLDLVSDTEIEINATTIDVNGALDVSGNAQLSGTVTVGADGSGTDVIFYSGTAGDNLTWDASEEKLTITGTNGQTALDVADGNLVVADSVDIEGDIDVNGTSNLDAVDIDGAVQIDNTITVGADDQGYDVIFYGDTASCNMTWDTSGDDLILNDSRLFIDMDRTDSNALHIDTEATTYDGIFVGADALTTGKVAYFYSNSSDTNTRQLVQIVNDNTSATGTTCLQIQQDAARGALSIDQNGNNLAIAIDTEATTEPAIQIDSPATTSHYVLNIPNCDALTTGRIAQFHSNSSDTGNRKLVAITNDHASATGATCLSIQQDAAEVALFIDQNANSKSISIDAESTTNDVLSISNPQTTTGKVLYVVNCDALTTGRMAWFYSDSAATNVRHLVNITNDHASADSAINLFLQQDGADSCIEDANGAKLTSAGVWTDASDIARKKDIVDIPYGLAEVLQMSPKKFKYKAHDTDAVGFIAQDMETIISEVVSGEDARMADVEKPVAATYYEEGDELPEGKSWETYYVEGDEETLATYYKEGDEIPEGKEVGDVKEEASKRVGDVKEEGIKVGDEKTAATERFEEEMVGGKGIAYGELTAVLVKAVQELTARVVALEG